QRLDKQTNKGSVRQLADQFLIHLNWFSSQTRRLLLVQDLVDSLKLAAAMWVMTYVGAVFNGVTILILGEFLIQAVKEVFRLSVCVSRLQDRLPGAVKRTKAE
uniref:Reticulon n=1 Tax=Acanthochromis polyacanthus TaxID=80966 RepID=A0A3Q1FBR6_9TELE